MLHDGPLVRDGDAAPAKVLVGPQIRRAELIDRRDVHQAVRVRQPRGRKGRALHLRTYRVGNVVADDAVLLRFEQTHDDLGRHNLAGGQLAGRRDEGEGFVRDGGEALVEDAAELPGLAEHHAEVRDDGQAALDELPVEDLAGLVGLPILLVVVGLGVDRQDHLGPVRPSLEGALVIQLHGPVQRDGIGNLVITPEDVGRVPLLGEGEQPVRLGRIPRRLDVQHLDSAAQSELQNPEHVGNAARVVGPRPRLPGRPDREDDRHGVVDDLQPHQGQRGGSDDVGTAQPPQNLHLVQDLEPVGSFAQQIGPKFHGINVQTHGLDVGFDLVHGREDDGQEEGVVTQGQFGVLPYDGLLDAGRCAGRRRR
mmetsp:Transcript_22156/g.63558  ORF Transcript_22156/g.63558 Transcript_22156/m.63558 type:complete len:366 (-) Transcript_22156:234-1331(-)